MNNQRNYLVDPRMAAEYGPNNQYTVGPLDPRQAAPHSQTMPPRNRSLLAGAGMGVAGIGGGLMLAGAPPPVAAGGAVAGVPIGMAYEMLDDWYNRSAPRHAYNNEYTGMDQAPGRVNRSYMQQNFGPPYSGGEY